MKLFIEKTKHGNGFTLIELTLTVAIIAILSGIVITVINPVKMQARGRDSQRVADLKKLQTALELYYADHRVYPENSASITSISSSLTALVPDYIPSLPTDPKGYTSNYSCTGSFNYSYRTTSPANKYVIVADMETAAAASDYVVCSAVSNCTSLACNCADFCHAVQNPL